MSLNSCVRGCRAGLHRIRQPFLSRCYPTLSNGLLYNHAARPSILIAMMSSSANSISSRMPRVAIIGRPNVGKSTMFNRLAGSRLSLVDDHAGMTRDRIEAPVSLLDLQFTLVDTPGLDETATNSKNSKIHNLMMAQTEIAVSTCDAVIFVIDGRYGLTSLDIHFARWLRRRLVVDKSKIILVANKCEGHLPEMNLIEAQQLGFGEAVPFSAEHGEGRLGLFEALDKVIDRPPIKESEDASTLKEQHDGDETNESKSKESVEDDDRMQLAVVGRPNVGKSTLVNALLGEDNRVLVGPDPGVTRDSVSIDLTFEGRDYRLIDTAGLSGATPASFKKVDKVDAMGMSQSIRAIRYANVVLLLLDASLTPELAFSRREATIAKHILDQGRCLVPVANKLDLIPEEQRPRKLHQLQAHVNSILSQARGLPVVPVSALAKMHIERCLRTSVISYDRWSRRIPTGPLNRFIRDFVADLPLPRLKGRVAKLKYITQVKSRPPTFCVFGCHRLEAADNYQKAMIEALRDQFELDGIPIRLLCRVPEKTAAPRNSPNRSTRFSAVSKRPTNSGRRVNARS